MELKNLFRQYLNFYINIGVQQDTPYLKKRSINLSNLIVLILVCVEIFVLIFISDNHNIQGVIETFISVAVYSFPVLLNLFRRHLNAKIYLSWIPPLYNVYIMILQVSGATAIPVSYYDGHRFYLLAFGCLPYLLFGRKELKYLGLSIIPSLLLLVLIDPVLSIAGIGYDEIGIKDSGYRFSNIRSILAYFFISASGFALRYIIDKSDDQNKQLIEALENKNVEIKKHANIELQKANDKLLNSIRILEEREFVLNQSQKIAKYGSWEYHIENGSKFLSDELLNIFGLSKNFDYNKISLSEYIQEPDRSIIDQANQSVIDSGESYDLIAKVKTPLDYNKWVRISGFPIVKNEKVIGIRGVCYDVTYFKEAEELVKEREYQYRSLFENAFDPIVVTDLEGNITAMNGSICDLLHYSKEELYNTDIKHYLDPMHKDIGIDLHTIKIGHYMSGNYKLRDRNDHPIDVEASIKNLDNNRIMIIIRDITEILKVQKLIMESEAKFKASFTFSAIGMAIVSLEGKFLKVNNQLCSILGYREDELLAKNYHDLGYKEDTYEDLKFFDEAIKGLRNSFKIEKRFAHKNKSLIWINTSCSLVKDSMGTPSYFVIQFENINQRKIAEIKLIERETQFRTLVEKALVGIYIIRKDYFEYVNDTFCRITGFSLNEILHKKHIAELVFEEDQNLVRNKIAKRLIDSADNRAYEFRLVKKNGEIRWVEVFGNKIPYKGEYAIIGSIIDISERKDFEREQALLASIVKSSDNAIISCDRKGFIKSWNPGAQRIFGYDENETRDKHLSFLLPADDKQANVDLDSALSINKSGEYLQLPGVTKKKGKIDLAFSISSIKNDAGRVVGISIVGIDETFRNQAEKIIRESEERYRTLVEKATEALVVLDTRRNRFVNVSDSAETLFKYSKEKLLTFGPGDISPEFQPDGNTSTDAANKWITEAVEKGTSKFEWTHLDSEGNLIPCEIRLVKLPSEDPVLIRASIIDITDRLEHERQLAEANKKIGELKLMALRSVMNPHFIFNVLNSIQYYITQNDRLNALNYLSTFSQLIRGVLNHSVSNKIKLEDEINLLKNYIELEKIRFENKFEYKIDIEANLDIDTIEIPSLLVQPYVENAILHGLNNKKGNGLLTITIYEKDDLVFFDIEDNGIGREASKKLNSQKITKHKSMGIKLTEERLKLINENKNVSVNIEDLYNGDIPTGTKVTIGIVA